MAGDDFPVQLTHFEQESFGSRTDSSTSLKPSPPPEAGRHGGGAGGMSGFRAVVNPLSNPVRPAAASSRDVSKLLAVYQDTIDAIANQHSKHATRALNGQKDEFSIPAIKKSNKNRQQIEGGTKDIEQLREELHSAKSRVNELSQERRVLSARLLAAEKNISQLQKRYQEQLSNKSIMDGCRTRSLSSSGVSDDKYSRDFCKVIENLRLALKTADQKIKERDCELKGIKEQTKFRKLKEYEDELKTYYLEAVKLKRTLEHQEIGASIIEDDPEKLLQYDDALLDYKRKLSSATARIYSLQETLQQVKDDRDHYRRTIDNLQCEIEELRQDLSHSKEEYRESVMQNERLMDEKALLIDEKAHLMDEKDQLIDEKSHLMEELIDKKENIRGLEEDIAKDKEDIEELNDQLQKSESIRETLENKLDKITSENESLAENLSNEVHTKEELLDAITDLISELKDVKDDLMEADDHLGLIQRKYAQTASKLESTESSNAELESRTRSLKSHQHELEKQIAECQRELSKTCEQKRACEEQLEKRESEVEKLRSRNEELEKVKTRSLFADTGNASTVKDTTFSETDKNTETAEVSRGPSFSMYAKPDGGTFKRKHKSLETLSTIEEHHNDIRRSLPSQLPFHLASKSFSWKETLARQNLEQKDSVAAKVPDKPLLSPTESVIFSRSCTPEPIDSSEIGGYVTSEISESHFSAQKVQPTHRSLQKPPSHHDLKNFKDTSWDQSQQSNRLSDQASDYDLPATHSSSSSWKVPSKAHSVASLHDDLTTNNGIHDGESTSDGQSPSQQLPSSPPKNLERSLIANIYGEGSIITTTQGEDASSISSDSLSPSLVKEILNFGDPIPSEGTAPRPNPSETAPLPDPSETATDAGTSFIATEIERTILTGVRRSLSEINSTAEETIQSEPHHIEKPTNIQSRSITQPDNSADAPTETSKTDDIASSTNSEIIQSVMDAIPVLMEGGGVIGEEEEEEDEDESTEPLEFEDTFWAEETRSVQSDQNDVENGKSFWE
ncbi:hypothetical protein HDU67_006993 [Dinochytrium kinnereticum]|nr:hypothetical protein HDU67_006993 [Dinochytrium kinnereticum]